MYVLLIFSFHFFLKLFFFTCSDEYPLYCKWLIANPFDPLQTVDLPQLIGPLGHLEGVRYCPEDVPLMGYIIMISSHCRYMHFKETRPMALSWNKWLLGRLGITEITVNEAGELAFTKGFNSMQCTLFF